MTVEERHIDKLVRSDRDLIAHIIPHGAHVLDLGCGDGTLLADLIAKKGVTGHGVDIDESNLIRCLERGLSVCQSNLDNGLNDFPDNSYDYVILNQTLQVINQTERIIGEMLRVGKYGLVGFPNFGHFGLRLNLLFTGNMPRSAALPFEWYNTPNIHQLTVRDFKRFCTNKKISIIREEYFMFGKWRKSFLVAPLANLFAVNGMFVLEGGGATLK